jgi:hypothetical protein
MWPRPDGKPGLFGDSVGDRAADVEQIEPGITLIERHEMLMERTAAVAERPESLATSRIIE